MESGSTRLTVFFEEPFWIGVFERMDGGKLSACKVTFGAEPKDYEVYAFILREYDRLAFGPAVRVDSGGGTDCGNPKRRQREIQKQLSRHGTGSKSQQALQLQREAMKTEREEQSKARREAEQERRYQLRREKRKEKHKGH